MKKDTFYFNPINLKKSLVIADTTKLAMRGAFLKPFPKFIDSDTIEQIVWEPGDKTDNILQACLRNGVALILITNN
jgi:hypothetical protein